MADPATLGMIGIGTSLIGGLTSAYGAESGGAAQQQMYNYKAAVAKINSQIDLQNADYALDQGEAQATAFGGKAAQQRGQIIANQGASGIQIGSGSTADVVGSQAKLTSLDLQQIRGNAAKVSYDYRVRSTSDLNDATLNIMAGDNAKTAGDISAFSSIIGSAGSVSSKWLQGSQAGMFSSFGGGGTGTTGGKMGE